PPTPFISANPVTTDDDPNIDPELRNIGQLMGQRGGTPLPPAEHLQQMRDLQSRNEAKAQEDDEDAESESDGNSSDSEDDSAEALKRRKRRRDGVVVAPTDAEVKKKEAYKKRKESDKYGRRTWCRRHFILCSLFCASLTRALPDCIEEEEDKLARAKQVKKCLRKKREGLWKIMRDLLTYGKLTNTPIMVLISNLQPTRSARQDYVFTTPDLRSGEHPHLSTLAESFHQKWIHVFKKHRAAFVADNMALRDKNQKLQIAGNKKDLELKARKELLEEEQAKNSRLQGIIDKMNEESRSRSAAMSTEFP
ncbi:hypothetical protein P7C70_g8181, partial [Phenoliferia sp. Uapishka_3]